MQIFGRAVVALSFAVASNVHTIQTSTPAPQFDVVSIKRNLGESSNSSWIDRPDGGLRITNIPVMTLIARAYPPAIPAELIGLPEWTRTERYDVSATSVLTSATKDDRAAMLRAVLAERFKLSAHVEQREQPVFDLVFARADRRLGSSLTPTEIDCEAQLEAERAAVDRGDAPPRPSLDRKAPAPRCRLRMVDDRLEGDATIPDLATMLRAYAGRRVLDKTGLVGFYRITMTLTP